MALECKLSSLFHFFTSPHVSLSSLFHFFTFPHVKLSSLFHFHFPQFSRSFTFRLLLTQLHFQASLSSSSAFTFLSHANHDLPLQPATDHDLLPLPLSRHSQQRLSEQWLFSACSFCFNFLLCERSGVEFKRIVEFKFVFFGCCCWVSLEFKLMEFKQCKFYYGLCYEFCFISTLVFML